VSVLLDLSSVRDEFSERMDAVDRVLTVSHRSPTGIERDARGMAIVLMFAAYERLLFELAKALNATASGLRVGNRRLRPGFRALALHDRAKSLHDSAPSRFYVKTLVSLLETADQARGSTLASTTFPDDGSYMRSSQVRVWCNVYGIEGPELILARIWQNLDAVVVDRNAIAHGRLRADEVGRERSLDDIRRLAGDWRGAWTDFVDHVEKCGNSRDFYRTPR
jgi:hypothetical protein